MIGLVCCMIWKGWTSFGGGLGCFGVCWGGLGCFNGSSESANYSKHIINNFHPLKKHFIGVFAVIQKENVMEILNTFISNVKEAAYVGLRPVRPVLEYSNSVWDKGIQDELENVQNRELDLCNRYLQLWNWEHDWHSWKWESFKKRRRDSRLITAEGWTDDLILLVRNKHSLTLQVPIASTDIYKCNFFTQTIRGWNALPDSILSSAEGKSSQVKLYLFKVGLVHITL